MLKGVNRIDEYTDMEKVMIEDISEKFSTIQNQVENLASISEQHTASTLEILATMESQNERIMAISASLHEITNQSESLRNLIK